MRRICVNRSVIALVTALALGAVLLAAGCGGDDSSSATSAVQAVPFDRAFIDAMVPHHEQAIAMAKDAQAAGLSEPVLVEIADAIISTQQTEIDQMTGWREKWFGSSTIDPAGADALGMSMGEMGMSESPMDFASEPDVNGAFASMMMDHHQGAIDMAQLALEKGQHEEITDIARAIVETQQDEINVLQAFAGSDHDMGDMGG